MNDQPMPLVARILFALTIPWRILLDGALAARVHHASSAPALPAKAAAPPPAAVVPPPRVDSSALELLALLQREGRFVDFVEQDVDAFSDADVGVAARVVHGGCRKALRGHGSFSPVRAEDEGARITLEAGFDPRRVKLVGNVSGSPPFTGTLKHKGWEVSNLELPEPSPEGDPSVVASAEVEL